MAAAQVDQARKRKGSGGEEMMTRRVKEREDTSSESESEPEGDEEVMALTTTQEEDDEMEVEEVVIQPRVIKQELPDIIWADDVDAEEKRNQAAGQGHRVNGPVKEWPGPKEKAGPPARERSTARVVPEKRQVRVEEGRGRGEPEKTAPTNREEKDIGFFPTKIGEVNSAEKTALWGWIKETGRAEYVWTLTRKGNSRAVRATGGMRKKTAYGHSEKYRDIQRELTTAKVRAEHVDKVARAVTDMKDIRGVNTGSRAAAVEEVVRRELMNGEGGQKEQPEQQQLRISGLEDTVRELRRKEAAWKVKEDAFQERAYHDQLAVDTMLDRVERKEAELEKLKKRLAGRREVVETAVREKGESKGIEKREKEAEGEVTKVMSQLADRLERLETPCEICVLTGATRPDMRIPNAEEKYTVDGVIREDQMRVVNAALRGGRGYLGATLPLRDKGWRLYLRGGSREVEFIGGAATTEVTLSYDPDLRQVKGRNCSIDRPNVLGHIHLDKPGAGPAKIVEVEWDTSRDSHETQSEAGKEAVNTKNV